MTRQDQLNTITAWPTATANTTLAAGQQYTVAARAALTAAQAVLHTGNAAAGHAVLLPAAAERHGSRTRVIRRSANASCGGTYVRT